MKKSLILGVAMALGITASAYAANPFSDVPKDSWAYDAVNKLAAAGIINGFPNGTFGGEKLMTRYEMAQIVAKAMAKGANVDRLAAEFAEELDALGVRVAALEKKQDNVTITGAFRARYINQRPQANQGQGYIEDLRTRLWVNGAINDDWQYVGMLQNVHDMSDAYGDSQDGVNLYRVFVTGRIGAVNVTAGRYEQFVAQGNILDAQSDGLYCIKKHSTHTQAEVKTEKRSDLKGKNTRRKCKCICKYVRANVNACRILQNLTGVLQ